MPSFDVVSEVDLHELSNAIDQANREVTTRFDFKDTGAKYETKDTLITLTAQSDFQLNQMLDILKIKLSKRQVDVKSLDIGKPVTSLSEAKLEIKIKQGIEQEMSKKIVKMVKTSKLKVQASIQGEKIRITGKKRDDLQDAIALLKDSNIDLPLQYDNFRD